MSGQMHQIKIAQTIHDDHRAPCSGLLQLPEAPLDLVLQQLDQRSLASTAVTCSKLRHAVPASTNELTVYCNTSRKFKSFRLWLDHNRNSLTSIKKCSIFGAEEYQPTLRRLPCPGLIQLHLQDVVVQFGPADGSPGVLHDCTGLTCLGLEFYEVEDSTAAAAAITALPQLKHLNLAFRSAYSEGEALFAELQLPSQLTHLSLDCSDMVDDNGAWKPATWSHLSGLTNLGRLELKCVPHQGVPGGVPSQLVKLTCLDVRFGGWSAAAAEQFQHLSSLAALQQLSIQCFSGIADDNLSGIEELSQLTGLSLESFTMQLRANNTYGWARLPALEKLALTYCVVQPDALKAFTQLRALSLDYVRYPQGASLKELLGAVAKLSLLTELLVKPRIAEPLASDVAAAFTALTASTNLCTLKVGMKLRDAPDGFSLFKPGAVYPHLRVLDLRYGLPEGAAPVSEQQLQQVYSCCPAVEVLALVWSGDPSPTAWLPLQQLSALTLFAVSGLGAAAPAVVLSAAAQLTGLKFLNLSQGAQLADTVLLQLTALTALTTLYCTTDGHRRSLTNTAPSGHLPDVWVQLRDALCDAA